MFWKSLNLKINLAIVAVLVVVMGGAALYTVETMNRQAITNTKNQAKILSETLTNIIRIDMEARCQKDVMKVIRMMREFKGIETIRIFDDDGVIIHSADPAEINLEVDDTVLEIYNNEDDMSKPFHSEEGGHRSFCMLQVIYNEPACYTCHEPEKEVIGVLEVCLSMAQTEEHIRENTRINLLSTITAILLVMTAISVLMTVMVNRPIKALVETMKSVEGGDLDVRVKMNKKDELGRLGESFNSMISRLDETNTEVERLHREQMLRSERLASIGEMAASVAHEIKNPLAGLAGATQILAGSFKPDESRYSVVKEMLKLTDRLDKTVRDLLSFAKEAEPNWVKANLNDVIKETLFYIAKGEGVDKVDWVEVRTDPEMPDVPMDVQHIQQVLTNLVINAKQAAGENVHVDIIASSVPTFKKDDGFDRDKYVEVCVKDNGPGIADDKLSEIFKPFYTTKNQGTGLGLPICRKIVDNHGGEIHATSRFGSGAAFYLLLPKKRSET